MYFNFYRFLLVETTSDVIRHLRKLGIRPINDRGVLQKRNLTCPVEIRSDTFSDVSFPTNFFKLCNYQQKLLFIIKFTLPLDNRLYLLISLR